MSDEKVDEWGWNLSRKERTEIKMRMTDVATTEQMFRVIQSILSPKAEPFKMWMAKVAGGEVFNEAGFYKFVVPNNQ